MPEYVYKAFPREGFADEFIGAGRFRIGSLKHYKTIEDDNRIDKTEGEASYTFEDDLQQIHITLDSEETRTSTKRGQMHVSGSWGNPTYIFCTSLPGTDLDYLRDRFGRYIVRISNVEQFIHGMQEAIRRTTYPFIGNGHVRGRTVEYSKDLELPADLEEVASCELAYYQKPPEYSCEQEYRFVAMMDAINPPDELPDFIELDFGGNIEYAERC